MLKFNYYLLHFIEPFIGFVIRLYLNNLHFLLYREYNCLIFATNVIDEVKNGNLIHTNLLSFQDKSNLLFSYFVLKIHYCPDNLYFMPDF